ncbi:MAG: TRL-like family protein [Alistipes sp.]
MKKILALACVALFATSCSVVKTPVAGMFYTNVKDGLSVTSNTGSSKVGTASVVGYVGIVSIGDASIQTAAKDAGISRIHHVDYESKSYVGVYSKYTIIVYGE